MSNIHSILGAEAQKAVHELESKGWQFRDNPWDTAVEFKSPNMKRWGSILENRWPEITKEYLLEREAGHSAQDWAGNIFHNASAVINPLADELKNYFLKKGTSEFGSLYASDAQFKIIISPKIKNKTPRKVKVTIEIS